MTLYEIDGAMLDLIDPETGEVKDFDEFVRLEMERGKKIDNIGCWIKNLRAEANAVTEEAKKLTERAKRANKKADRLQTYLMDMLHGEKWNSARLSVSYRKSEGTVVDDLDELVRFSNDHPNLVTRSVKPNLDEVKKYIQFNGEVPFAHVEQRVNMKLE